MRKLTIAQIKFLALLEKHGAIKLVKCALNYCRMIDKNNKWVPGRVFHATTHALIEKKLIVNSPEGYKINETTHVHD